MIEKTHPKGSAARAFILRTSFGWAGWLVEVVESRPQFVDQPVRLVEVLSSVRLSDGDELGHGVIADAERIDVTVTDTRQMNERGLLRDQSGQSFMEHDSLGHDSCCLAGGLLKEAVGMYGSDGVVTDIEHSLLLR